MIEQDISQVSFEKLNICDLVTAAGSHFSNKRDAVLRVTGLYAIGREGGRWHGRACAWDDTFLSVVKTLGRGSGKAFFFYPWELSRKGQVRWSDTLVMAHRSSWENEARRPMISHVSMFRFDRADMLAPSAHVEIRKRAWRAARDRAGISTQIPAFCSRWPHLVYW